MDEDKRYYHTYTITESDIDCIERLCGYTLSTELRAGLMRQYGPKGELAEYIDIINACDVDDMRYCEEICGGLCGYPSSDTLLTQICLTVLCYESGRFHAGRDNYHKVMGECCVSWIKDVPFDQDIPF